MCSNLCDITLELFGISIWDFDDFFKLSKCDITLRWRLKKIMTRLRASSASEAEETSDESRNHHPQPRPRSRVLVPHSRLNWFFFSLLSHAFLINSHYFAKWIFQILVRSQRFMYKTCEVLNVIWEEERRRIQIPHSRARLARRHANVCRRNIAVELHLAPSGSEQAILVTSSTFGVFLLTNFTQTWLFLSRALVPNWHTSD